MELKRTKAKLKRLNLIRRTIRNITQLLIREKDAARLVQGVCDSLVENRGYYNAWIALLDESGALAATAESGLGRIFIPMVDRLQNGKLPQCVRAALVQAEVALIKDPVTACKTCPLSGSYAGRGAITVRIDHDGKVFGILCASLSVETTEDPEELALFREIADDIGFALHNIELESQRHRANEALELGMSQLAERVKELDCLYSISNLVGMQGLTIDEILREIVDLVPKSLRFPDRACARIVVDGHKCQTQNFKQTQWRQVADISVSGDVQGYLEIGYLDRIMENGDRLFLEEERHLIDAVAERIGKIVTRKNAERSLLVSEKRFRDLVKSSLVGILIVQNDHVVFKNAELERLWGFIPPEFNLASYEGIHPADVEKIKQVYQNLSSGKSQRMDVEFRFYPQGKMDSRPDMKWVYCRASLIEHAGKNAILINMMDVTRAKELEHLLIVQDKMASLGRVAAGIAHEIRNPLSGINIYINTLGKLYDRGGGVDKIKEILQNLQSASHKIESVIRRVMDFSKPSAPSMVLTNINQPIKEAISLNAVTLRKRGIDIDPELADDLPKSLMDPRRIEEIIVNLIANAADAMEGTDKSKRIKIASFRDHDRISVKVFDSGPGVESTLRDKIFDPFYTTKKDSTGIGLNLCQRIISDHGGTMTVDTGQWGGAEFLILLPIKPGVKSI